MTARPVGLVARPYELPALTPGLRTGLLALGLGASALLGAFGAHVGGGALALLLAGAVALLLAAASSYAALVLLILLLLLPLQSLPFPPLHINQIDAVYLAAVTGLVLRFFASGQRFEPTALSLGLATFMGSAALTSIVGVFGGAAPQEALSHFRGLAGYALVPLLFLSAAEGERSRVSRLLILLCVIGGLTSAQGVLSWAQLNGVWELPAGLQHLALPETEQEVGAVPARSGDFGYLRAWAGNLEGNTLGAFLLLLTPLAAYLSFRGGSDERRVAFGAITVLLVFGIIVSYSRSAYLGLAAASLPAFWLLWRRRPLAAAGLAVAGLTALALLIGRIPGADDRLATVSALSEDPTVAHRQTVYQQAFGAVLRSPVWGVGFGTEIEDIGAGADSLYVFLLLRGGLLMVGAALLFAAVTGRVLIEAWRQGRFSGVEFALASGLLGFAVHSLVDYSLWNPKVALAAWLLAGGIVSAALRDADREVEAPAAAGSGRW